jgi:hypothetical protein
MHLKKAFSIRIAAVTMAAVFVVALVANEKPSDEFRETMRSNAGLVDLAGTSSFGKETNIDAANGASLGEHIKAKDYDGIVADALAIKANFEKLQPFWVGKNMEDAINFTKTGIKASGDLEAAAKAKDNAGITAAHFAIANACRQCHLAHRVVMLTDRSFQIR